MSNRIDYKKVCAKIKDIRREKGMTQEDVAYKMGYSRSLYARLESGTTNNPMQYLDLLLATIGPELLNAFPFDISLYTNHRLFAYMLVFGKTYSSIATALGLNHNQVKRLLLKEKKEYLFDYVDEIEALFPDLEKYEMYYDMFMPIGKNSLSVQMEDRNYIFMNVSGFSPRDTLISLCEMNEIHIQEYD